MNPKEEIEQIQNQLLVFKNRLENMEAPNGAFEDCLIDAMDAIDDAIGFLDTALQNLST